MRNMIRTTVAGLAAVGLVFGLSAGAATAADVNPRGAGAVTATADVPKGSLTSYHIATDGLTEQGDFSDALLSLLRTPQVNSVTQNALRPGVVTLDKLSQGTRDAAVNVPEVYGRAGETATLPAKTIVNLGGKYFGDTTSTADDRYTTLGTVTLPAGRWQVITSVKFNRTAAGDAGARPQVGLRIGQDQTVEGDARFGREVGTVGGNDISPAKGHDLFGTTTAFVTLDEETEVGVYGFGYTNTAGTEGSGEITAAVSVTPIRVG